MKKTSCISTIVAGTGYRIEYEITRPAEKMQEHLAAYGICCRLFDTEGMVASEHVKEITSERGLVTKFVRILEKNQVFPVHVREVIEDLLILEYEEKGVFV